MTASSITCCRSRRRRTSSSESGKGTPGTEQSINKIGVNGLSKWLPGAISHRTSEAGMPARALPSDTSFRGQGRQHSVKRPWTRQLLPNKPEVKIPANWVTRQPIALPPDTRLRGQRTFLKTGSSFRPGNCHRHVWPLSEESRRIQGGPFPQVRAGDILVLLAEAEAPFAGS